MVHNNVHVWSDTGLIMFCGAGVDPVVTLPLLVLSGKCPCDAHEVSQIVYKLFEEVVFGYCPVSYKGTKSSVYGLFGKSVCNLQYSVTKPVPKCTFYNQIQYNYPTAV